jgi:hypothetical protein
MCLDRVYLRKHGGVRSSHGLHDGVDQVEEGQLVGGVEIGIDQASHNDGGDFVGRLNASVSDASRLGDDYFVRPILQRVQAHRQFVELLHSEARSIHSDAQRFLLLRRHCSKLSDCGTVSAAVPASSSLAISTKFHRIDDAKQKFKS